MKKSKKKEMERLKEVANAFFELAKGYDYKEDVVTVYKGDVTVTPVWRHKGVNPDQARKILEIKNWRNWTEPNPWKAEQMLSDKRRKDYTEFKLDLSSLSKKQLNLLLKIQKTAKL